MTRPDHEIDVAVADAVGASTALGTDDTHRLRERLLAEATLRTEQPTRTAARRSAARRRTRRTLIAVLPLAVVVLVAIALSPWEQGEIRTQRQPSEADNRVVAAIPGIETASAEIVLNRVADRLADEGSGSWNYVRRSSWTEEWGDVSLQCLGRDCEWVSKDGTRTRKRPDFPIVRTQIWERWSDGETELGRTQFQYPVSRPCDAEPSPADQCLGTTGIWLRGKTRSTFPRDPAAGAAELNRLVDIRNQAVARASKRSGRFPPNTISATEIGFWLLSEPVYDARNRGNLIRALAAWPGARNGGPVEDRLGRRGVELRIPMYRRYDDRGRRGGFAGTFFAVFDVRSGDLLQYTQSTSLDPLTAQQAMTGPGGRYASGVVIDEQSRQREPTPTDEVVEQREAG